MIYESSFCVHMQVPEYVPGLEEEEVSRMAFEIVFAFDEVIALGYKENVTISQVKQYTDMESVAERQYKADIAMKQEETKRLMREKATEIEKSKVCMHVLHFSQMWSVLNDVSPTSRRTSTRAQTDEASPACLEGPCLSWLALTTTPSQMGPLKRARMGTPSIQGLQWTLAKVRPRTFANPPSISCDTC